MKHAAIDLDRAVAVGVVRSGKRALAKQATRDKVLAAARSMFAERGFDAATIRDIADAADLSTGAVFANFADKAELFDAVMAADYDAVISRMAQACAANASSGAAEVITTMFRTAYAFFYEQLPLIQACLAHAWSRDEAAQLFHRSAAARVLRLLADALEQGVTRGELDGDMDCALVAEMLWEAYLGNYRHAVFGGWTLQRLGERVQAQTNAVLCGFVRR